MTSSYEYTVYLMMYLTYRLIRIHGQIFTRFQLPAAFISFFEEHYMK